MDWSMWLNIQFIAYLKYIIRSLNLLLAVSLNSGLPLRPNPANPQVPRSLELAWPFSAAWQSWIRFLKLGDIGHMVFFQEMVYHIMYGLSSWLQNLFISIGQRHQSQYITPKPLAQWSAFHESSNPVSKNVKWYLMHDSNIILILLCSFSCFGWVVIGCMIFANQQYEMGYSSNNTRGHTYLTWSRRANKKPRRVGTKWSRNPKGELQTRTQGVE